MNHPAEEAFSVSQGRATLSAAVTSPADPRTGAKTAPAWFTCDISRSELKELMRRSDSPALRNFAIWIAVLLMSGYAAFRSYGTWWAVPAFLLYGTIYSSSDARWHECQHGTAFKTRWLNEFFYELCSFMTIREASLWRWSHSRHHTHTIIVDYDPEIQVTRPADLIKIAADFVYLYSGTIEIKRIALHAFGSFTKLEQDYIPEVARKRTIVSSQIYLLLMAGVITLAIAIRSFLPILLVWTPRFYGGWLHQLCGLTQHAGLAENEYDHRKSTRTVFMNPVYCFLYMNMNYHIEHHMYPTVPFFALPRLYRLIRHQMPRPYQGIVDVYREIVPALWRQSKDSNYYVVRTLPSLAGR
jgi:fatty acid desaturase